jgi:NitT/TauT family transport system permease protein
VASTLTRTAPAPGYARRALGWTSRRAGWAPRVVGPIAIAGFLLGTWQAGLWNDVWGLQPFTLPRPSDIVRAFGDSSDELLANLGETFRPALFGYLLGNSAGVLAGALLVVVPAAVGRRLSGFFTAVQSLPIIALVPVVALWFGSGLLFKTVVVGILTFPSMMVYANRGMTHLGEDVQYLMASYNASARQTFMKVRLPNSLPFAFTALKYTVVLAVIGVVVAEIIRSRSGLGYEIDDALQAFDTAEAWAAAAILAGLGITWYSALGILERVVAPWTLAQRRR